MEILSSRDSVVIASFDSTEKDTFHLFYAAVSQSNINVEISVTDIDTKLLVNTYDYTFTEFNQEDFVKIVPLASGEEGGYLELYTSNILSALGYITGNYNVSYQFYLNILGNNSDEKLFIRRISSSRKELILDYVNKKTLGRYKTFGEDYFHRFSQEFIFNKFLNFGDNNLLLVLNAKNQVEEGQDSIIIKLYETLPSKYTIKDVFWAVEFVTDAIEDTVSIDFASTQKIFDSANILSPPQFNVYENIGRDYTSYKTYNQLIDTSSLGDKYFAELYTNNYIDGIDLDIDYSAFDNFVHFGSALQMVNNFRNKVITIEFLDTKIITSSVSITGSQKSSSVYYDGKKSDIIGNFTRYENFLYFNSGSYFTSSLYLNATNTASQIDAAYPKSGSDISTYTPYEITASVSEQWYSTMSVIAIDYDTKNDDALTNTLPAYIKQDVINKQDNEDYILFTNMMGEFFDSIYSYIVATQRTLKRENKFKDGVPADLIWNMLRNYGLNLNNGENLIDLTRYNYGYYYSGSTGTFTELEQQEKIVTTEIWNRILNNYPYIFKSKGTEKSIRSLFNCFGLPNSLIQIQEFGGPYSTSSLNDSTLRKYTFDYTDFTFLLEMTGSEYINVPWTTSSYDSMKPDSIEFKFRAPSTAGDMDLFSLSGSSGEVKLELEKLYDVYGNLRLSISSSVKNFTVSSSVKPFYNNEFYSIHVNRSIESDVTGTLQNYFLNIKNHDDYINTITINESHSISIGADDSASNAAYIDADAFYFGGQPNSPQKFNGAFDEFRLWAEPLTDRTFDFHAQYSVATNGNTLSSSLETLAFRLSLNDAFNLGAIQSMSNDAYSTASYAPIVSASIIVGPATASAVGFVSIPEYPYNFSDFERSNTVEQSFIAAAGMENKKIRIEQNSVVEYIDTGSVRIYPLKGDCAIFDYKPQGEVGEFDNAPPDIDTLLIGFTPVDIINKDIIAFFGNNDILGAYGDFNNLYEDYYPKNTGLIKTYWDNTKNPISFDSYLDYISTYNKSLFDTVIELVPAKATLILGTVYEQNILRRNRVKLINPEVATNYKQHLFPIDTDLEFIDTLSDNASYEAGAIDIPNSFTFDKNELDDLSGVIKTIVESPVEAFDLYKVNDIVYVFNEYNLITFNNGAVNRQRYNVDRYRNFDGNTKNTSLTTVDRGPVVVLTASSPKKLIVNYADIPKLIVKS